MRSSFFLIETVSITGQKYFSILEMAATVYEREICAADMTIVVSGSKVRHMLLALSVVASKLIQFIVLKVGGFFLWSAFFVYIFAPRFPFSYFPM